MRAHELKSQIIGTFAAVSNPLPHAKHLIEPPTFLVIIKLIPLVYFSTMYVDLPAEINSRLWIVSKHLSTTLASTQ